MKTKEGLQDKWEHYAKINSEDTYSKACIDAAEAVAAKLEEGSGAKEALDALYGHDLTGFMASEAAKAVVHFHPRGEEIRVAWNNLNGVRPEKGIVNTAVVNINDDGSITPEIADV